MAISFYNPGLNCAGKTCIDLPLAEGADFGVWDIGRSKNAVVRLASKAVSRLHFRIQFRNGDYWIQDLHSHNGTLLDGKALIPGKEVKLSPFANIFAGGVRMVWLMHCDETLPNSSCGIAEDTVDTVAATLEEIAKDRPDNLWEFASSVIQIIVVGISNQSSRLITIGLVMVALLALITVLLLGN